MVTTSKQKGARTVGASTLMADREIVYTVEEVAAMLKVHVKTVRKMIHTGEMLAFRAGREYRIHKSTLDGFMRINRERESE